MNPGQKALNQAWSPSKQRHHLHALCAVPAHALHGLSLRGIICKEEIMPTKSQRRCDGRTHRAECLHAVDAQFTGRVILHDNPNVSGILLYSLWGLPCMLNICLLDLFSFLHCKLFEGGGICLHWIPYSASCTFLHIPGTQEVYMTLIFVWSGLIDNKHLCYNTMTPAMRLNW